jgi:nucleoside-triphosphatase
VENTFKPPDSLLASFFSGENLNSIVLITGPSGSGKTSLCTRLVTLAKDAGLSAGGILCPAVFDDGKKVGIDQLEISSGELQRLGVRSQGSTANTVGCWHMNESVMARGNQIFAGIKDHDVIIIDELGPLELEDGDGYQQALDLLDEGRYCTAFVVVRPALLPIAKLRWPQAQVCTLEGVAV